ncbi:Putative lipase [Vanrija pseudolonga]|uniref:Lipase n=1 Tax=Vanrija pseudolonga TaxID=143232 RepID=A0AAF0YCK9_9TREE|nr:Putative lipase [Vanrija pseudolonga]
MSDNDQPRTPVHLVVLLHGLYGAPANLWCLEAEAAALHEELRKGSGESGESDVERSTDDADDVSAPAPQLAVLVAKSYVGQRTWDGIDVNAHRAADEIDEEIARLDAEGKDVVAFSVTGYSLGGLIARALIGHLHTRTPSFFATHRPAAFSTIATPHLGVLRYGSWKNTAVHAIGQHLFSRTGRQLYLLDTDKALPKKGNNRPLLTVLSDPEGIYLTALRLFPSVTILANGVNDLTVPYPTAAIVDHDPYIEHEAGAVCVEVDEHNIVTRHYLHETEVDEVEAVVEASSGDSSPKQPGVSPARALPKAVRPWLPPVFFLPWRGPLRYALFPLIPFLLPLVLTFVAVTFTLHSFQSAERIRLHSSSGTRRLLHGLTHPTEDNDDEGNGKDANEAVDDDNDDSSSTGNGAETPALAPQSPGTQPLLSTEQRAMIRNLSAVPQLERVVAWFPAVFNSHATIVARNANVPRFAFQTQGIPVVREWARRVVVAGNGVIGKED